MELTISEEAVVTGESGISVRDNGFTGWGKRLYRDSHVSEFGHFVS